jgi:predicted transposase/invertase (TIGR01784 family)
MSKKERVLISFDYALKRLLCNKANYDVLEGFLSELFGYDVKVKNIVESENNKNDKDDKYNRVDLLIEDEKGELLAVELQFDSEPDYFHRMAYGASKILVERMNEGQSYSELRKVISINIVYFDLGQGDDYVYHSGTIFRGIHTKNELQPSKYQRDTYRIKTTADVYPEYYILKIRQFDDKAKDKLDEWIYFFKHNSVKDEFTAKGLDKVRKTLLYENLTSEEKAEYDKMLDIRHQNQNLLSSTRSEGKYEGKEETRKEYELILAREREEKKALLDREREKEAALARERAEKEAALSREREKEAALVRALAELEALKKDNQSNQK